MSLLLNPDLWPAPSARQLISAGPSFETCTERLKLAEAVTLMAASTVSSCRGLRGPRPVETAAAIRPQRWGWGRGSPLLQGQGEALVRALELCRTQPLACPRSPSSPACPDTRGPGRPWGESQNPPPATFNAPRTTVA